MGVITREQLTAAGLTSKGVTQWVQSGRLHRLYRGVYSYGHDRLRVEGRWLAAVMACGPGAVLSHRDAACLWELRQGYSGIMDVTVPSRSGRVKRRGLRVHRSRRLAPDEVTTWLGIPVTTVARTLLDLADVLDHQALRRAITEAEYRKRLDIPSLNAVVENNPGRRGGEVRKAMEAAGHRTRSKLEGRFLAFIERHGIGLRTMRLTERDLEEPAAVLADLAQAGVSIASSPRRSSYAPPRRARTSSASAT